MTLRVWQTQNKGNVHYFVLPVPSLISTYLMDGKWPNKISSMQPSVSDGFVQITDDTL